MQAGHYLKLYAIAFAAYAAMTFAAALDARAEDPFTSIGDYLFSCPPGAACVPPGAMCVGDPAPGAPDGKWNDGHAQNHDWYKDLKAPSGGSCCNGDSEHGDCRWTRAYTDEQGVIHAIVNGSWKIVPPGAVLPDRLNKDPLHAHVCAQPETGYVYCFLRPGAGT